MLYRGRWWGLERGISGGGLVWVVVEEREEGRRVETWLAVARRKLERGDTAQLFAAKRRRSLAGSGDNSCDFANEIKIKANVACG